MSDLPERLRAWETGDQNTSPDKLLREAADEIERLDGHIDCCIKERQTDDMLRSSD